MKGKIQLFYICFIILFAIVIMAPAPSGYSPFNVRDFGAKGDGNTDDSDSIQAAIDSAAVDTFCSVVYILLPIDGMKELV
jgi:hypothetical protein